jgi:hypothetical protein
MTVRKRNIRFKNWYSQDYIAGYICYTLGGTWRNSSGCWDGNSLHVWYQEDENKTYVHFSCDYCYTWEGDVVKDISQKIKSFIRRIER